MRGKYTKIFGIVICTLLITTNAAISVANLLNENTKTNIKEKTTLKLNIGKDYMEYGDAPEDGIAYPSTGALGAFPTCWSCGPAGWVQHDNYGAWLGPGFDFETDGNAGLCPNCFPPYDQDEGFQDGDAGLIMPEPFTIDSSLNVVPFPGYTGTPLGNPGQLAVWGTDIDIDVHNTMPGHEPYLDAYFNLLIDWNQNGMWGDPGEHVVQNFVIPALYIGPLSALNPPNFIIGPNSGYVWARFSITENPVPINWNGEGVFEDGESEDYLLYIKECEPSIDVEKYVWDPINETWVDDDVVDLPVNSTAAFLITIHNNGSCCDLTNITVYDFMEDSLEFKNATPFPNSVDPVPGGVEIYWTFTDPLPPSNWIYIYLWATVLGPVCHTDYNYVNVSAFCNETGETVYDEDYAYVHAINESLEFGDAPECGIAYPSTGVIGAFPTCKTCGNFGWIQHNNFGAYFGPTFEFETDGNAGLCPTCFPPYDQDECFNDGDAGLIMPDPYTIDASLNVIPCPGGTGTPLGTVGQTAVWGIDIDINVTNFMPSSTTGYVNLLIDWNQNGMWGDPGEHVLVNFPVPNGFSGPLSTLGPPNFIIGPNSGYVWARFSITETTVPTDWNGEGVFEDGETEDYLLEVEPLWPNHKMHFPQLPDPDGWDVFDVNPFQVLADDWMCSETGWVKDIHFWGSWYNDIVGDLLGFHLSIHADIPAGVDGIPYSRPGALLWERDIFDFTVTAEEPSLQGWFEPPDYYETDNHMMYYRYDILLDPEDWFYQENGTIYWLDISAYVNETPTAWWGWKTSLNHWNDDAVYFLNDPPYIWAPLEDPLTGESLDLAFVITGEPGPSPDWYWKSPYPNYAPHLPGGMPDFDQEQDQWQRIEPGPNGILDSTPANDDVVYGNIIAPGPNCHLDTIPQNDDIVKWAFCGPVAVANCLWWFDSKYADPTGSPGDGVDCFPLVEDYGVGDDHMKANVPYLIEDLATQMGTCAKGTTDIDDMVDAINNWFVNKGLTHMFTVNKYEAPEFGFIESEIERSQDVILLLGFYNETGKLPDQMQMIATYNDNLQPWTWWDFQSFVPSVTHLDAINITLNSNGPPCDIEVNVYDTFMGTPIGTSVLNPGNLPNPTWVQFHFDPPVPLIPGNTYYFDVREVDSADNYHYEWWYTSPDVYPPGQGYMDSMPGIPPDGSPFDWTFITEYYPDDIREGGHYVTCAGVNSNNSKIAFSDPALNISNPAIIDHNDPANVSHDIYSVSIGCPVSGANTTWWLPDYPTPYQYTIVEQAVIICPVPHVDVEKYVWDPDNGWVDEIMVSNGTTVRFKIIVHNDGGYDLVNISVKDVLPDCLEYANNAVPNEPDSINGNILYWNFTGPLQYCETITIQFDANVTSGGINVNLVNVSAESIEGTVYDEDTAVVNVTLPVASFTYEPLDPTTADIIYFNSTSYDPDGYIVNWTWDFGDGNISYGEFVTHQYTVNDAYLVTLQVEDNDGNDASTAKLVLVGGGLHITDLLKNWNFISLPFNKSVNKTDIIVKYNGDYYSWTQATTNANPTGNPIISPYIFGWNRVGQTYTFADVLDPGYGYWMYAYQPCGLWVENMSITPDDYITALKSKWNIVGLPDYNPVNKTDLIVSYGGTDYTWSDAVAAGIISNYIFGWNRASQTYIFADALDPGYAYWMYAYYDCVLKK